MGSKKAFKSVTRTIVSNEAIFNWEPISADNVSQAKIKYPKAATFPRQSGKCDQDQAIFYPGQKVVLLRQPTEAYYQAYRAYHVSGKSWDTHDQETFTL